MMQMMINIISELFITCVVLSVYNRVFTNGCDNLHGFI